MSWLDRLKKLDLPQYTGEYTLDPVFVGGPSNNSKTKILSEIMKIPCCSVSKVNFQTLFDTYNGDTKKIAEHLINRRTENMIYEHTIQCLKLNNLVLKYMKKIDNFERDINSNTVSNLFNECCNIQTVQSYKKIIIILNMTKSYFNKHEKKRRYLLYLQTIAYLSLLAKIYLYPYMKILIFYNISDIDPILKAHGVYDLFNSMRMSNQFILTNGDESYTKKIIIDFHRRETITDDIS